MYHFWASKQPQVACLFFTSFFWPKKGQIKSRPSMHTGKLGYCKNYYYYYYSIICIKIKALYSENVTQKSEVAFDCIKKNGMRKEVSIFIIVIIMIMIILFTSICFTLYICLKRRGKSFFLQPIKLKKWILLVAMEKSENRTILFFMLQKSYSKKYHSLNEYNFHANHDLF